MQAIHHIGNSEKQEDKLYSSRRVAAPHFRNNNQATVGWHPYRYFMHRGCRPCSNLWKLQLRRSHGIHLDITVPFSPGWYLRKACSQRTLSKCNAPPYESQITRTAESYRAGSISCQKYPKQRQQIDQSAHRCGLTRYLDSHRTSVDAQCNNNKTDGATKRNDGHIGRK